MTANLAHFSDSIRLFLHVIGATIWVGGQLTLAALVPALRKINPELPRKVAARFNTIAWPAYTLLLVTGAWNMASLPKSVPSNYSAVIGIKMIMVLLSGVAAFVHTRSKTTKSIAIWGSLSGLAAISATYIGVLLAG